VLDMNRIVGTHDIVLMTLDTLRYDVASRLHGEGRTPRFGALLPAGWEKRLTTGSFTYAAHQAFFAGFLPVPERPGIHARPFAARFEGSETTGPGTWVFDAPHLMGGLAQRGYHSICVGGVGFFNRRTPLSTTLPGLFAESHWEPRFGVSDPASAEHQFRFAARRLSEMSEGQRVFLFINVSAIHGPNHFYLPGASRDGLDTHAAALAYVDSCLPILLEALDRRPRVFGIVCSDHGSAYGEGGHWGHRAPHPVVWTVPYGEFLRHGGRG
jgi:hypothetical protein